MAAQGGSVNGNGSEKDRVAAGSAAGASGAGEGAFAGEPRVIVGTAGHVDHGKSSLVLALTGTDPDRLPQEKARGITIDLGFAELTLPSGRSVGVVDVPGHEHYVRAMAAGAAGVDVALMVVAADDGEMPQTREHRRILQMMGARHMVVALSKIDLVEPDWVELVKMDIEEQLAETPYAGCAVVPVSARTGEGLDELLRELDAAVDAFARSDAARLRTSRPARLSVDRSFNVMGVGAVVTGTLRSGTVAPGDTLEVLPAEVKARVRSVQVHSRDVERAVAGQRVALNLTGVELGQLPRGSTVCAPDSLRMHDRFDARLHWFGRDGAPAPLVSGERVHVCAGTSQALGRVLLMDGLETLEPGAEAYAQVRLEEPLTVASHDRFVAMAYSPVELVGGGEILWTNPPRRTTTRETDLELFRGVEEGDARRAVLAAMRRERRSGGAVEVARSLDMPLARLVEVAEGLVAEGELVPLKTEPPRYIAPELLESMTADILAALRAARAARPTDDGMPILALRDAVAPALEPAAFAALLALVEERGAVGRFGSSIVAAEDLERVRAAAAELTGRVEGLLAERGFAAPFVEELTAELGMSEGELRHWLGLLVDEGRVVMIDKSYALTPEALRQASEVVARTIRDAGGAATASQLREALGISRKYALPLLEYLDRTGLTVRDAEDAGLRRLARE